MTSDKIIRIGGASAFLGDSSTSTPQLIAGGNVDYIVYDYLAEVTMMILTKARAKRPDAGYARDFVGVVMRENIKEIAARGIKVVSNAGGVNPKACRDALFALAHEVGVDIKIAVIEGDDLMPRAEELKKRGITEMYDGSPWPGSMLSMNAYLGAFPIAEALAMGADIVLTSRIVDSALTLGPLLHEFGWADDDYDRLAQGSLAGHINECGAQATGGLHTDWELVPDWSNIGYPVLECQADGAFVVTKPAGTGGLVAPAAVAEQMLYEVGDPQVYLLPDVTCDFSQVKIEPLSPNRVKVSGAVGRPPTDTYKVCAGFQDGYRSIAILPVIGIDAARKAERQAGALLDRTRAMMQKRDFEDYRSTWIESIGAEASYGENSRARSTREVACRIAVEHEKKEALAIFAREAYAPVTSMSPGSTAWHEGRPSVSPVVRLFSFLIPKKEISIDVILSGETRQVTVRADGGFDPSEIVRPEVADSDPISGDTVSVPLIRLAWGRSGDKGDSFNIGIIARQPGYLPFIREALTTDAVSRYFSHVFRDPGSSLVERFELPGIHAINFLLHESLGGGGMASMRLDTLAKGMAQQLLDYPVTVPKSFVNE